jgi:hypothetical protein
MKTGAWSLESGVRIRKADSEFYLLLVRPDVATAFGAELYFGSRRSGGSGMGSQKSETEF